jgi:hypothetical protein
MPLLLWEFSGQSWLVIVSPTPRPTLPSRTSRMCPKLWPDEPPPSTQRCAPTRNTATAWTASLRKLSLLPVTYFGSSLKHSVFLNEDELQSCSDFCKNSINSCMKQVTDISTKFSARCSESKSNCLHFIINKTLKKRRN